MISASEWAYESLYRLLEKDERFEICVVVARLADRDKEVADLYYEKTLAFFKNGYRTIGGYDTEKEKALTFEEMGAKPDILIHSTSWWQSLPPEQYIIERPLGCMNIYMPYGMNIANDRSGGYTANAVFNKEFQNFMYRTYSDSPESVISFEKYELLKGFNTRFSGYSKMDELYDDKQFTEDELRTIWKIPENADAGKIKKNNHCATLYRA